MTFPVRHPAGSAGAKSVTMAMAGLMGLCVIGDAASARDSRQSKREEYVQSRPVGPPVVAIVSLRQQRVTVYDTEGWIMRAPVSSGQTGYETPAGIYSILQRKAEHYSNLYDDASMPFMQRLTWSGIALHAGPLPGYPASHGCVRMPYGFAERLFGMTKLGMRVIVVRDDISPAEISHPVLFKPTTGEPDREIVGPSAVALGPDQGPVTPLPNLRRVAAAKAAAAEAAAKTAEQARRVAAAKYKEAARANKTLRLAQGAKARAEAHLKEIERRLEAATTPDGIAAVEEAKAKALAKVDEMQAQLDAVQAEVQPILDEVAKLREAAHAAQTAKVAADEEAKEARRKIAPVSVFISRATQRLYVRQSFEPLFESPVTIANPDEPLGTYIFTALAWTDGETDLRWSAVSMYGELRDAPSPSRSQGRGSSPPAAQPAKADIAAAKSALDRISISKDALDRLSAVVSPGSALIVSDEALSRETGAATDFIVIMSSEPQGGIKIRRRGPEARNRYDRFRHERFLRRSPYAWGQSFW
jgi:L,D-transpeptidase catalytic domain